MPYGVLFYRLIVRPLRGEPVRTLLTALAVALGVAVVLAIEMAGGAAAESFRSSFETLAGDADYEVSATGGVAPETLTKLALLPFPIKLRPRIEDFAVLNGRTVPLLGLDVLSEEATAQGSEAQGERQNEQKVDTIWVGEGFGLRVGDRARLLIQDQEADYSVGGLLQGQSNEAIVMDLAMATEALRRDGGLDRILVKAASEHEGALRAALPPGVMLARYGSKTEENRRMLAAFRWNLRVLSYVALIVGAFLIYNTISVSVVRRRNEIGVLRALGATRGAVLSAFVGEAACFGVIGGLLGVALGRLMADAAVQGIAITVESLYVSSRPGEIALTWPIALAGVLIACIVSLLSAFSPAWEASRIAPVEAMSRGRVEHEVRRSVVRYLAMSAACAVVAFVASQQAPVNGKPLFGYAAAIALIGTSAFAIPLLVHLVRAGRIFGAEAMLASRSLIGSLRRTSVLVGALSTAIAMTTAVGIMVGSFRQTVLLWMDGRLQADLYLQPAGPVNADRHPTIDPALADALRRVPEVDAVDSFRGYEIAFNGLPATFAGVEACVAGDHGQHAFLSGTPSRQVFREVSTGENVVIVSEPFANKHNVSRGDTITVPLGPRLVPFRVLEVYFDYASERGYILTDRRTMLKYLPDPAPSNLALYLKPGVDLEEGRRAIQGAIGDRRILVLSNRYLREQGIRIFDRTFAITYALEAVAIFVAIMGVAGALLALVIDRRREFGLLRFLGASTGQVWRLVLFEAGLLGLLATVAGLALGYLLSLLLVYVINKQSFGWTIQFHWPVAVLLGALTLIYVATVVSAVYPARVASRLNPIEMVHEE
jgi:putative ABC transport system permease protein